MREICQKTIERQVKRYTAKKRHLCLAYSADGRAGVGVKDKYRVYLPSASLWSLVRVGDIAMVPTMAYPIQMIEANRLRPWEVNAYKSRIEDPRKARLEARRNERLEPLLHELGVDAKRLGRIQVGYGTNNSD